jgi:hypothetical protein
MRAEAVSWDEWSVGNPPPIADTDKWHVQIAPDEVKVLSLDQLDDLYRLSIVDSETQVWQTGMTEWQPLRVIAGLDEAPPPPRRAPPKPPTRTVVMPPPALNQTQPMTPSMRPAAPAPRSAAPSARPTAPAARPVSLAPASFYPEPIQPTPSAYNQPVAYTAPTAFAATLPATSSVRPPNSVRPLVVSHAPPSNSRRGGGFGRFLVGLALLAGIAVTAYRNDFVREAAHSAHQDALYARLEAALGGPAFGTLRALEQSAGALPASALGANIAAPIRELSGSSNGSSATAPDSPASALGTSTPPPVVSLESLGTEQKGQAASKSPAVAPAAVAPAPVRAAVSFQPAPTPAAPAKAALTRAATPTPPARAAAAPTPARSTPAKPAVEKKPEPVPQKPASEMTDRERLNAAIGQSMLDSASPKAKKPKSRGNEYDPLNPNL